jgi:hypothetical protein
LQYSLASKNKKYRTSQVNNAGDLQESREEEEKKMMCDETSNQLIDSNSYCIYYPVNANRLCPKCPEKLDTIWTNIEKHVRTHGINKFVFKCGMCGKEWPSWRSVVTHYNKSSCHRLTSIVSPIDAAVKEQEKETSNTQKKLPKVIHQQEEQIVTQKKSTGNHNYIIIIINVHYYRRGIRGK